MFGHAAPGIPILLDHLLALFVCILYPIWRNFGDKKTAQEVHEPHWSLDRCNQIDSIRASALAAATLAIWASGGRSLQHMGFSLPQYSPISVLTWLVFFGYCYYYISVVLLGAKNPEFAQEMQKIWKDEPQTIPLNDRAHGISLLASATDSFFEGIFYFAYLPFYLINWLPMYEAMAAASILFGVAHFRYGTWHVVQMIFIGLMLTFWAHDTRSLLAPILFLFLRQQFLFTAIWIAFRTFPQHRPDSSES